MTPKEKPRPWLVFALDFGPLLAFFLAYKVIGLIAGTAIFMGAILIALALSLALIGRVSPMTWISAVLVIGFGALTIWFRDPRFIQLKPTIIYAGFAVLLAGGLVAGKPLLKPVFGMAFDGLSDVGWMKLSRNWALFFAAMAIVNEALRATLSFDDWLTAKVWGLTILSLVFAFANIPMLMRHGFAVAEPERPATPPVPPVS